MTLHRRGVSKQDILRALTERLEADYREAMWEALVARGVAAERLRIALERLCDVSERNLGLLDGLSASARDAIYHEPEGSRLTRSVFVEPLERLLLDGAADGSLAAVDAREMATVLFNAVGHTYRHLRTGHGWDARACPGGDPGARDVGASRSLKNPIERRDAGRSRPLGVRSVHNPAVGRRSPEACHVMHPVYVHTLTRPPRAPTSRMTTLCIPRGPSASRSSMGRSTSARETPAADQPTARRAAARSRSCSCSTSALELAQRAAQVARHGRRGDPLGDPADRARRRPRRRRAAARPGCGRGRRSRSRQRPRWSTPVTDVPRHSDGRRPLDDLDQPADLGRPTRISIR